MLTFACYGGLGFIALMMLAGGAGHLWSWREFAALVQAHAVLPPWFARAAAFLVTTFELALGACCTALLFRLLSATAARPVLLLALALAVLFRWYLGRLLAAPQRASSCGCSPLSGPLTSASRAPAEALILAALAALAATLGGSPRTDPLSAAFAALWGATLAGILLLAPATVPTSAEEVAV